MANFQFKIKDNAEYDLKQLDKFKNIILIASKEIKTKTNIPIIISKNPRLDFQRVVMKFFSDDEFKSGIHSSATLESNVKIGKNVYVGPNCYIAKDVVIGDNTKILSNTVIFGVTEIGKNCVISSNCTIGSEGFSFSYDEKGFVHFNHIGGILIGDNVWIGSNCTIDRGTSENTIIGTGTKIDNMVHIAHNCIIGRNCILTGMVGLAGSTVLEDFVVMGAKSGATGHLTIGQGSQIAAKAGITKDLAPGKKWAGYPAKEMDEWKKDLINIRKLSKKD